MDRFAAAALSASGAERPSCRPVPADAPIELGYIVLPLDLKCVGLLLAEWDDAMLLSADLKLRRRSCGPFARSGSGRRHRRPPILRRHGRHLPGSAHGRLRRVWTGTPHDAKSALSATSSSAPAPARARRISLPCGSSACWPPARGPTKSWPRPSRARQPARFSIACCFGWRRRRADDDERARSWPGQSATKSLRPQNDAASYWSPRCAGCTRCASARSTAISCKWRPALGTSWACRPAGRFATSWPTARAPRRSDRAGPGARASSADLMTLVHSLTKGAAARSVARLVRDTVSGLFELYRETTPAGVGADRRLQGTRRRRTGRGAGSHRGLELPAGQIVQDPRQRLGKGCGSANWEGLIERDLPAKVLSGRCIFNRKPLPEELVAALSAGCLSTSNRSWSARWRSRREATHQLLERFAEHYRAACSSTSGPCDFRMSRCAWRRRQIRLATSDWHFGSTAASGMCCSTNFKTPRPPQWRVLRPLAESVTAGRRRLVLLRRRCQAGDLWLARRRGGDLRRARWPASGPAAAEFGPELPLGPAGDRRGERRVSEPDEASESRQAGRAGRSAGRRRFPSIRRPARSWPDM